jgi:UDP-N-acetylglucosamine 2-epimerase (non-hydrolysing)
MKLKVLTILGTRPEIIKMSQVLIKADKYFDHIIAHTGQNFDYELNEVFFKDLGLRKPDYFLEAAGVSPAATISNVITKVDEIIDRVKPDAVVLYGDTNSCLCVISAKRKKIPIFHLEAGNRCFDQRVPEEINRKIVDHLSDVNLVHSEHARRYLLDEGLKPELIFKVGSPMFEIFEKYMGNIDKSDVLEKLNLEPQKYFIVSMHREENVDYEANLKSLLEALNHVAEKFNRRVIVSTHPRTQNALNKIKDLGVSGKISFLKPLGFFDYVNLQKNSFCVLSDSGTLTEESSILKFPSVMIRQTHERPEGMDVGAVIMSGINKEAIEQSVLMATDFSKSTFDEIDSYARSGFSDHIIKIIQSYTGYINRTVWRKDV